MFRIIEGAFKLIGASGRVAEVDLQNRLLVSTAAPITPVGVNDVQLTESGQIQEDSYVDTYYTITNAKTLVIDKIRGSSEDNEKSSSVSVFYDSDGTSNNLQLIATGFISGSSFEFSVHREFVGNGIGRIVLRRERLDEGDREIFGQFTGYEQ